MQLITTSAVNRHSIMSRFSSIPFDVFSAIMEMTDVECLLALSQCNRQCRDWASSALLWKEIISRMQERGIQLPADGFTGIAYMSFEQLKRSALRACRIHRKWSSPEARPTRSFLVDCSPSRYQHGVFHTTQRLRWVVPITEDFYAVKLGYNLSSGFLQIWRRDADSPRIVVHYQHDWITWGYCTDIVNKAWYFVFSEHNINQQGDTLHVMRFSGFESDPGRKLDMKVVAKYPTYGAIIKVFLLDISKKTLCVLYSGLHNGTITLFFVPDWFRKPSAHIDTGIEDGYPGKNTFICILDTTAEKLMIQFEPNSRRRACQYVYDLRDFEKYMTPVPAFPNPLPSPPLLKPVQVLDLDIVDTPMDQVQFQELGSTFSIDRDYSPVLPFSAGTRLQPTCSHVAFSASFGRDLNPTYMFQHMFVGLPGAHSYVRRLATPAIRRMAFGQDYMDTNTTERFPVPHAVDLRGHELIALGHACAAWIEARPPLMVGTTTDLDRLRYDLKIVVFPWRSEMGDREIKSRKWPDSKTENALSVCTIECPPELDLAKVTGIWLDATQGSVLLGLKWGKFMVLRFD